MTDARSVVSDYVYDDADRLLSVTYPDSPVDNITYEYDQGDFGIGELTTITTQNWGGRVFYLSCSGGYV